MSVSLAKHIFKEGRVLTTSDRLSEVLDILQVDIWFSANPKAYLFKSRTFNVQGSYFSTALELENYLFHQYSLLVHVYEGGSVSPKDADNLDKYTPLGNPRFMCEFLSALDRSVLIDPHNEVHNSLIMKSEEFRVLNYKTLLKILTDEGFRPILSPSEIEVLQGIEELCNDRTALLTPDREDYDRLCDVLLYNLKNLNSETVEQEKSELFSL
ncbi:hypothetical protein ACMXYX_17985 (plasmid) [Neptuniibacter sp. QD72_48]|uniref:hypothetical protein n=1 Tax=Neptuniibacter sp. QD72_48 TaxID=3398214 RepID=UPI0039F5C39D